MTNYTYKVLLIYPQAQIAGVRAFIEEEIERGRSEYWINLCLSANGQAPATHGWCEFHATKAQATKWLDRFTAAIGVGLGEGEAMEGEIGVPPPPDFVDLPREDQATWLTVAKPALLAATGTGFDVVFNDEGATFDNTRKNALLSTMGLQRISQAIQIP